MKKISLLRKSFLAGLIDKGDAGARVFDKRGGEIDSEYLKGKVTGFVGRLEDNVLYTTYVNI